MEKKPQTIRKFDLREVAQFKSCLNKQIMPDKVHLLLLIINKKKNYQPSGLCLPYEKLFFELS